MTMATEIDLQHCFIEIQATKESEDLLKFFFSSKEPVKRYLGDEVLDHDEESVDLTRLNSGTAPLLFNHDQNIILGRVQKVFIQN